MGDIKQVIIVRVDLAMGKGKIAAQVGHACVLGVDNARKLYPEWVEEWWPSQEKIVLKVDRLKDLEEIKKDAFVLKLPCVQVTDAGHTQIEPGTVTCISIGPAPKDMIDKITNDLKLL